MNKYNQLREEIQKANEAKFWVRKYGVEEYDNSIPITLEDCLIALKKINEGNCSPDIAHIWFVNQTKELLNLWQLNKPLQDQSDEVHNLLFELICKE